MLVKDKCALHFDFKVVSCTSECVKVDFAH